MVVDVHWHAKIVGVSDFPPLPFRLIVGYSDKLKDSKGRSIINGVCSSRLLRPNARQWTRKRTPSKSELLSLMREKPGLSLAFMAKELGWFYSNGSPNKTKVHRALHALVDAKLVTVKNSVWELTKAGREAASPRAAGTGRNAVLRIKPKPRWPWANPRAQASPRQAVMPPPCVANNPFHPPETLAVHQRPFQNL